MSQYGECNTEVVENISRVRLGPYHSTKKEVSTVLGVSSSVRDYEVRLNLPNTLIVHVVHVEPVFAVFNQGIGLYALVTASGSVVDIVERSDLQVINVDHQLPSVGVRVDEGMLFSYDVARRLSEYGLSKTSLMENDIYLEFDSGVRVIVPSKGDAPKYIGSAILLLSRLKQGGADSKLEGKGQVTEIDLRFKNPVLR